MTSTTSTNTPRSSYPSRTSITTSISLSPIHTSTGLICITVTITDHVMLPNPNSYPKVGMGVARGRVEVYYFQMTLKSSPLLSC